MYGVPAAEVDSVGLSLEVFSRSSSHRLITVGQNYPNRRRQDPDARQEDGNVIPRSNMDGKEPLLAMPLRNEACAFLDSNIKVRRSPGADAARIVALGVCDARSLAALRMTII
jgi:hypothetical protein